MPTIEFSSVAMTYQMGYLYSVTGGTYSTLNVGAFKIPLCWDVSNSIARIYVFDGVRPTTRPTNLTALLPVRLIEWDGSSTWSSTIGPVTQSLVGTTHTLQITSILTTALLSGTATWFAIANHGVNAPYTTYGWVTGTVGLPGSGADLIIADTNIVSGQQYKIANLTLTQSSVFTY